MISENVKLYCYEDPSLIENYELAIADKIQIWHCHHRVEDIMNCGAEELIAQGCYENRPAHDLIFLTPGEHSRLHNAGENNPMFGKKLSAEARAKISSLHKGQKLSEETRAKMSAAHIGKKRSEETRTKISSSRKGQKLSEETRAKMSASMSGENHPFFGRHHSEEARAKISASNYGKHFWNNGVECRFCKESPGPGWTRGRLKL